MRPPHRHLLVAVVVSVKAAACALARAAATWKGRRSRGSPKTPWLAGAVDRQRPPACKDTRNTSCDYVGMRGKWYPAPSLQHRHQQPQPEAGRKSLAPPRASSPPLHRARRQEEDKTRLPALHRACTVLRACCAVLVSAATSDEGRCGSRWRRCRLPARRTPRGSTRFHRVTGVRPGASPASTRCMMR